MLTKAEKQLYLNVDLIQLDSPHKTSHYILQLPNYKKKVLQKNTSDQQHQNDILICNQLAEFVSQQQLNGIFFLNNFKDKDFYDMMKAVCSSDILNYSWIWEILRDAIEIKHELQHRERRIVQFEWMDSNASYNWYMFSSRVDSYEMIWLDLVNSNINKMSIIQLRKRCQEYASEEIPGITLVECTLNGILNEVTTDIKHIQLAEYIKKWVLQPIHIQILSNEEKHSNEDKEKLFFDIMQQYENILNLKKNNNHTNNLHQLFAHINEQCNISQIMDIYLELKHTNIENSKQCKFESHCTILNNVLETRKHHLLERALKPTQQINNNTEFDIEDSSKMEILNLIHTRLFHKGQINRRRLPNIEDIAESSLKLGKNQLFKDKIMENNNLMIIASFCEDEEYDTDAIYDDLFPDNDGQSNVYSLFKVKQSDIYYLLKHFLSQYVINPADKSSIGRNLIELDFGDHLSSWNVQPKFDNMKEEWLGNEYFPILLYVYNSLYSKSEILHHTKKNKTQYNLSTDDILCVKMYTDTNELQANFRCAFRSSADIIRRSQFVHWATNLHMGCYIFTP